MSAGSAGVRGAAQSVVRSPWPKSWPSRELWGAVFSTMVCRALRSSPFRATGLPATPPAPGRERRLSPRSRWGPRVPAWQSGLCLPAVGRQRGLRRWVPSPGREEPSKSAVMPALAPCDQGLLLGSAPSRLPIGTGSGLGQGSGAWKDVASQPTPAPRASRGPA